MESWFRTLKTELVHHTHYVSREAARRDLFAYIETYYNRQRLHSTLGYRTPPSKPSFTPHNLVFTFPGGAGRSMPVSSSTKTDYMHRRDGAAEKQL